MSAAGTARSAETPRASRTVLAILLALVVAAAALSALRKDIRQGFDEVAHVSYVAQIQRDHQLWPPLDSLRMLDPEHLTVTAAPNYLNHPPLYYDALALLSPRIEGAPRAVLVLRVLNIALVSAALALLLALGLAAESDRLKLYAYAVPLLAVPVLVPLAGAVNNDNAAFLGGALLLFGAWRWLNGGSAWLALAGVVIASWAKLTGLLLCSSMLVLIAAYLFTRRKLSLAVAGAIIAALCIATLPYTAFMLTYGSPAPDTAAQQALLRDGSAIAGWAHAPRLSFVDYVITFAGQFLAQWMPALAERSAFQYAMLALPVLTIAIAAAGASIAFRRVAHYREAPQDVLVAAGTIAIAATFTLHLLFSYRRHLETGWMMDAYPRYYLPLIAVVPLACLVTVSALPRRWQPALITGLIAAPVIFRLLGGPLG